MTRPQLRAPNPRILVINDDQRHCETRRLLLKECGADVFTACGFENDIQSRLVTSLDLVLVDATNVGIERGEELCSIVKRVHPSGCVALLVHLETDPAPITKADRVISRTGPRRILVEINELLNGRLDLNLWEGSRNDDEDPVS